MPYKFVTEKEDYSHYASGRVFYSLAGQPAFPVRLASEIFQRGAALLQTSGAQPPYRLADPVCGGAYHLVTLAFLHWPQIASISASDVSAEALDVARRNLGLLSLAGINERAEKIALDAETFGKESHADALLSAHHFKGLVQTHLAQHHPIRTDITQQNIFERTAPLNADIIFADVPYGIRSEWEDAAPQGEPLEQFLSALQPIIEAHAILAVTADKNQKARHAGFEQLGRFKMGKRLTTFLRKTI
jgi:tRNA G10  N-methylase Trm11